MKRRYLGRLANQRTSFRFIRVLFRVCKCAGNFYGFYLRGLRSFHGYGNKPTRPFYTTSVFFSMSFYLRHGLLAVGCVWGAYQFCMSGAVA